MKENAKKVILSSFLVYICALRNAVYIEEEREKACSAPETQDIEA